MSQVAEHVGRVVGGRYRLVSLAGTGSSASVYRAEDARLGRAVAVKMLHASLASDPSFLKRFHAEAKAAAALNHPHIVRVFDWGDDEAGPYLVMEFLGGGSLAAMIDAGLTLSPAQAASVGLDAARALDYAARRGLVHRDVKPANILLDDEGRGALADFGLARAFAEAAWTEPAGTLFGTARYTSPEQAQGRPADGRSDVYSLALSLYEAIVGVTPFHGDSTVSLVMARVGTQIDAPEATGPLGPVLERALAPDAAERSDAARFLAELEAAAATLPGADPLPLVGTAAGLAGSSSDGTVLGARVGPDATALPASLLEGVEVPTGPVPSASAGGVRRSSRPAGPSFGGRIATFARRRAVPLAASAIALLIAAVIAALVALQVFVPKEAVPNLRGDTLSAAASAARSHHLAVAVVARRFVKGVPVGQIASQDPAARSSLAKDDAIDVVVSKGSPFVPVPAGLDGQSQESAAAALGAAGLHAAKQPVYSQSVPAGDVVTYSPTQGARWGDTITLQVSQGPQPVTIPFGLTGEDPATATHELESLGLTVTQAQEHSSTVPQGQVSRTDPAAGQTAHVGDTVTLYVSQGPVMVTVPDLSGTTVDQATAALSAAGLTPQNVYGPPGGNAIVYTTDPSAGSSVPQGSAVTIYTAPPGGHPKLTPLG